MFCRLFLPILIVSFVGVVEIDGQPCVPRPVENVALSMEALLSWTINHEETCIVSYYLVYIDNTATTEWVFAVSGTSLSVNFLPVCDSYIFRITAVSADNIDSSEIRIASKIPLPINANLTVSFLRVTPLATENVLLEWNVEEEWDKCADRFRVVIVDLDLNFPQDIYTYGKSLEVPSLAPCTSYEFGVVALYNWEIEGPVTAVLYPTPPLQIPPPSLSNIAIGNNYINLTWQLQPYPRNKCAVTQAYVQVSTVGERLNLTVPVLDQTDRQPFTVNLPNLRPDNLYFVNTSIVNIAGPSTPVILAVQTRP